MKPIVITEMPQIQKDIKQSLSDFYQELEGEPITRYTLEKVYCKRQELLNWVINNRILPPQILSCSNFEIYCIIDILQEIQKLNTIINILEDKIENVKLYNNPLLILKQVMEKFDKNYSQINLDEVKWR